MRTQNGSKRAFSSLEIFESIRRSFILFILGLHAAYATPSYIGPYTYFGVTNQTITPGFVNSYTTEDAAIAAAPQAIYFGAGFCNIRFDHSDLSDWNSSDPYYGKVVDGVEASAIKGYWYYDADVIASGACVGSSPTPSATWRIVRRRIVCMSTQRFFDGKCVDISPFVVHNKSGANLGPSDPSVGDPINPGTGNMWHVARDYQGVGAGASLSLRRVYNSAAYAWLPVRANIFGAHWSTKYDVTLQKLSVAPADYSTEQCYVRSDTGTIFCEPVQLADPSVLIPPAISVSRGDGKSSVFNQQGNIWIGGGDTNDRVVAVFNADNTAVLEWDYISATDDSTDRFDANGQLLSITARNGNVQKLTYSTGRTNDTSIERYPFDAPACGRVPSGDIVPANRLMCVTDNWGRQLQFGYDSHGRVTEVVDPRGLSYLYEYDGASGGCVPGNETTQACSANNLTRVTYPDGGVRTYMYNEVGRINGGTACAGQSPVGNGYGAAISALTGIIDENGSRYLSWSYDCSGRVILSEVGNATRKTTLSYGNTASNGSLSTIVTYYTGSPDNPQTSTSTFGMVEAKMISKLQSLDHACVDCGPWQTINRDSNGNPYLTYDFRGIETMRSFDASRNLEISRKEAYGLSMQRTITTSWNSNFRLPLQIAEPLRITTFTYDSLGNVLQRTAQATTDTTGSAGLTATTTGAPRTWAFTYNSAGQVTSATGPRTDVSDVTHYNYDAYGDLSTITDALGHVTSMTNYDASGRIGRVVSPNGATTDFTYTLRGWLSTIALNADSVTQTTRYEYDNAGQLKKVTFSDGSYVSYAYDDAHRLVSVSDGLGNRMTYGLDLMGNRTAEQVFDPNGVLFRNISRVFDNVGKLIQQTGTNVN